MFTTCPPSGHTEWWHAHVEVVPGRTLADWRALPEGTRAELIRGTLVMSPAPRVFHQVLVARFVRALDAAVMADDLGVVLTSPIDVRLADDLGVQPDIVFVAAERLHILGDQEIDGAPDLVGEVLSPSTGYYDATAKRLAYAEAGVRELWLIDPGTESGRPSVEVLTLDGTDFRTEARVVQTGTVSSRLIPGLRLDVETFFRRVGA